MTDSKQTRIKSYLNGLTRELLSTHRDVALQEAFRVVQLTETRLEEAEQQYHMALRILRKVAGSPTFDIDGATYQVRVRNNRPYLCLLEKHVRAA